jgi:hypothetical protein
VPAPLSHTCHRHPDRPAAARCTSCKRSYCRECIVDHKGRILCGPCLEHLFASKGDTRSTPFWRTGARVAARLVVLAAAAVLVFEWFHALGGGFKRVDGWIENALAWTREEP